MTFEVLARVSGAPRGSALERELAARARSLFDGLADTSTDACSAALRARRVLVDAGYSYDAETFTLEDVLTRRAGNCLGLALLIGTALGEHGYEVSAELRVNPKDDVHDAGVEHFARLMDPKLGVDYDSRLPEARDRSARFRFVPVEHPSLVVADAEGRARRIELTALAGDAAEEDIVWAPEAELVRPVGLVTLAASVLSDRAKALARSPCPRGQHRALRLALAAVHLAPENREAWAEVWAHARVLPESARARRLATEAIRRYEALGGDDSLWHFTRHRMTGDARALDAALARFPEHVEAFYERHVARPLADLGAGLDDAGRERAGRALIIAAWCFAESEILDLEHFYRAHEADVVALFSRAELEEVVRTFAA